MRVLLPAKEHLESSDSTNVKEIKNVLEMNQTTCLSDLFPSIILMKFDHFIIPLNIINVCLSTGTFPTTLKFALVNPLSKKPNLDVKQMSNCRPFPICPTSPN